MTRTLRLELTWVGKESRPRLEPRILVEDKADSHHARTRAATDVFDNKLVFGDNLLALKALQHDYAGRVRCIYIDPPYNTGAAFSHYDDGIEHSLWLSLMREHLEIARHLLTEDGSIWVSIDDTEGAYLRVLMDEVFGRSNFAATCVWQKRYSRENREAIGDAHEYILVFARDLDRFKLVRNRVSFDTEQAAVYKNPNNDPLGRWRGIPMTAQGYRTNQMYEIVGPTGIVHRPPEGRCWSMIEERFLALKAQGRIYFGKDGTSQPSVIRYLSEVEGVVPWTWWPHEEVGHTDEAKKESQVLFGKENTFPTPKPERLIRRVLEIATNPGDIVLDSFAGSGTTGAVAHKMGRRWIMVELGTHHHTHVIPRLRKVVDGEDAGGISDAVGWSGGGGFRCYHLAPSLIESDQYGNAIISKKYNAAQLAEAMCKHMGFSYEPSIDPHEYWRHGHSSERDFIFVTTASLSFDALKRISEDVGKNRTLLVCCRAFQGRVDSLANLTVKKIPQAVLSNCEWGRDDYSLRIASLPAREENGVTREPQANPPLSVRRNGSGKGKSTNQRTLFEGRE